MSPPPIPIPEHELIRPIGRGGSGQVWLARNFLGTYRAVKIIPVREPGRPQVSMSEFAGIVKFEPVSRLHDGLVDILQVGGSEKQGYFYYVLELADAVRAGQMIHPETYVPHTLGQHLRERGRLPVSECIRLGAAIASAMGYLHRQNLIHRDLKPSNIIFVNGFPKVADVGLVAGMTGENEYVGTQGFIAPEGSGAAQGDIYSLGKILYEMSTGNRAEEYPVLPADLGSTREDRELAQFMQIVLKCCRTSPRARYESADDLMSALLAFQFNRRVSRWSADGRPAVWIAGVVGAFIGIVFVIFALWRLLWLLRHSP